MWSYKTWRKSIFPYVFHTWYRFVKSQKKYTWTKFFTTYSLTRRKIEKSETDRKGMNFQKFNKEYFLIKIQKLCTLRDLPYIDEISDSVTNCVVAGYGLLGFLYIFLWVDDFIRKAPIRRKSFTLPKSVISRKKVN